MNAPVKPRACLHHAPRHQTDLSIWSIHSFSNKWAMRKKLSSVLHVKNALEDINVCTAAYKFDWEISAPV